MDDEHKAREILAHLIDQHIPKITECRLASSASEATEILAEYAPKVLFLDIRMPVMDGFEWLESLNKRPFAVIFATAFNQYAIKAIRFTAFDYLLKPIDVEDLEQSVDRLIKSNPTHISDHYVHLLHNINPENSKELVLSIASTNGRQFIKYKNIIHCEASGNYTNVYLINKQRILSSTPIGYYTDLLGDFGFIRVHKSHLVNQNFITSYVENRLVLEGGFSVVASRRRKACVPVVTIMSGSSNEIGFSNGDLVIGISRFAHVSVDIYRN